MTVHKRPLTFMGQVSTVRMKKMTRCLRCYGNVRGLLCVPRLMSKQRTRQSSQSCAHTSRSVSVTMSMVYLASGNRMMISMAHSKKRDSATPSAEATPAGVTAASPMPIKPTQPHAAIHAGAQPYSATNSVEGCVYQWPIRDATLLTAQHQVTCWSCAQRQAGYWKIRE